MAESIELSEVFPTRPERLYSAWLDSQEHASFTGSPAKIEPWVGGKFSAWDGYISGHTLGLEQNKRIIQSWRATDFPEGSPDSRLEISFDSVENGARITIRHQNLPDGQGQDFYQGWLDYYLTPMKNYFKPND